MNEVRKDKTIDGAKLSILGLIQQVRIGQLFTAISTLIFLSFIAIVSFLYLSPYVGLEPNRVHN